MQKSKISNPKSRTIKTLIPINLMTTIHKTIINGITYVIILYANGEVTRLTISEAKDLLLKLNQIQL